MLDPAVSLAFSLQSQRGRYALLVGSGLSTSAGILTGWEIVLDLIRRYAVLSGEEPPADPERWYIEKFNEEPNYSTLLKLLGKTATERQGILRSYFEPTEEDREAGRQVPTQAHKAIARLVSANYLRVIVTTNFDQLIETALREVGITPTVISTEDLAAGAFPLPDTGCLVVKPNGDYTDWRIKNTPEELVKYGPKMRRLLERIWEEYGLVIVGWSGEWDTALRGTLERAKNRRFTTFWCDRGRLKETGKRLTERLGAEIITIKDAESFFPDLAEKVFSVDDMTLRHPLNAKIAVASLKRHLDGQQDIRVHDLVWEEVETLWKELTPERFPVDGHFSEDAIRERIGRCERITDTTLQLLCVGVTFGKPSHDQLWLRVIQRIGSRPEERNGIVAMLALRGYPSVLLHYGSGIAALAAGKLELLARLLLQPVKDERYDTPLKMLSRSPIGESDVFKVLPGMDRNKTPLSDRVFTAIRDALRPYIPDDVEYDRFFDRFEFLRAVVGACTPRPWPPPGQYLWKGHRKGFLVQEEMTDAELTRYWKAMSPALPDVSLEQFLETGKKVAKLEWY